MSYDFLYNIDGARREILGLITESVKDSAERDEIINAVIEYGKLNRAKALREARDKVRNLDSEFVELLA